MKVNWEDVQEDYKKKDERIAELEAEKVHLKIKPEFRKVQVYETVYSKEENKQIKTLKDEVFSFHKWGAEYEEFETGAGNYTVAILEKENGDITTYFAHQIKFI